MLVDDSFFSQEDFMSNNHHDSALQRCRISENVTSWGINSTGDVGYGLGKYLSALPPAVLTEGPRWWGQVHPSKITVRSLWVPHKHFLATA